MKKTLLALTCALSPLVLASAAQAQTAAAPSEREEPVMASELVVTGQIVYRNRSEETAPVLDYGLDYFQRFEPLTAGDALKRVPSVAFLSDILESDGVRLRGLDTGYTQILINGEQVPGGGSGSGTFGSGSDRSFFVDRIPAELIERIEIVRSPSANRSGDAVAGAINIVLRDAYSLEGGFIRGGVLGFDDSEFHPTLGGVWSGDVGPGRLLLGANLQGRRNPKSKLSLRFDEPGADLNDSEVQTDVRDGTDYSFNGSYKVPVGPGELDLSAFFVHTDREADEDSTEYEEGVVANDSILSTNINNVETDQDSFGLNAKYRFDMLGGRTALAMGLARFTNEESEVEEEIDYSDSFDFPNGDAFEGAFQTSDIEDEEFSVGLDHTRPLARAQIQFGLQYRQKDRDTTIVADDNEFDLPGTNPPYGPLEAVTGGLNSIKERRLDPFVMMSGGSATVRWEFGVRYETTRLTVRDRDAGTSVKTDENEILPSAHVRWNLTPDDRISTSVARTVRRPSFEFLNPALLEAELGENDFFGNPNLRPETAWGLDVGYERRLGKTGIAGLNVFYRDIDNLIELANTGDEGSEGDGTFIFTARNSGSGQVWGVELDLSTPLTVIGLENTGVFLNYSWLDSDISDEFGSRRFNDQAEYVVNVGFIHDMPELGAAFGATYRKQGEAYSRIVGEEVTTEYGGDLEIFAEKRFGQRLVVRLTGSNLLDSKKEETFNKFETIEDQMDRSFDEYELEAEESGPVFQLIARMAF